MRDVRPRRLATSVCVAAACVMALLALVALPADAAAAREPRTLDGPILAAADANELAQSLADASDVQGVCYGWEITVSDAGSGSSGVDAGSGQDPSSAARARRCPKFVILTGAANYVSESSESEDSAGYGIDSNLPNPPTVSDLKKLKVGPGVLLDDSNDTGLTNSVQALPLIVADKGDARAVPASFKPKPASSTDHPTNDPSTPDWLRGHELVLILALVLIMIALVWAMAQVVGYRRAHRRNASLHAVLVDHAHPEKPFVRTVPADAKPHRLVGSWVDHHDTSEAEMTDDRRARALEAIEKAKESGTLNISGRQLKQIRGQLGAPVEAETAQSAGAQKPGESAAGPTRQTGATGAEGSGRPGGQDSPGGDPPAQRPSSGD